jgi:hypothetical protein
MRLVYHGPEPVLVPDARLIATPGRPVEVPQPIASSLLEQPLWTRAQPTKRTPKGSE